MKTFNTKELKIQKYTLEEILKGKNVESNNIDNSILYRFPTNEEHLNIEAFSDWEIDMFCAFHSFSNRPKANEKFIIIFNN